MFLRNKFSLVAWSLWLLEPLYMLAGPRLLDLDIRVALSDNGDARITERRTMMIDDVGTECYIVVGNLNGSEVRDLTVSDETGLSYSNIGEWDIDRSRSWKTGKCGIVYKHDGYEICWGLGSEGRRIYDASYTVTNLVKAYDDADGFNYMFVAEDVNPAPQHVKLTIYKPGTPLPIDSMGVWAFSFHGNIEMQDSCVVAESSEPFTSGSAMIAMVRFPKGLFHPSDVRQGTFDQLREKAFEGSDYVDNRTKWEKFCDNIGFILILLMMSCVFWAPLAYILYKWWQRRKFRKSIEKDLTWYRDIPYQGDLRHANAVCHALGYAGHSNTKKLISAYIMRMLYRGELKVENVSNPKSGKVSQYVAIGEEASMSQNNADSSLQNKLFHVFEKAAGEDRILQPKELERWMGKNWKSLQGLVEQLKPQMTVNDCKKETEQVKQLVGLKKFLKDFTLVKERHVNEVTLWKDYLIYASLFGIADQVMKDMKSINPEFFQLDQMAQQMAESVIILIPNLSNATLNGTNRVQNNMSAHEARSLGGGGSASWGGGGGFSGGGIGGGVR